METTTQPETIETLRSDIDTVDNELMRLISKRIRLTRTIAFRKIDEGLPIYDPAREEEIVTRAKDHPYVSSVAFAMRHIISTCRTEMYQIEAEAGGQNRE